MFRNIIVYQRTAESPFHQPLPRGQVTCLLPSTSMIYSTSKLTLFKSTSHHVQSTKASATSNEGRDRAKAVHEIGLSTGISASEGKYPVILRNNKSTHPHSPLISCRNSQAHHSLPDHLHPNLLSPTIPLRPETIPTHPLTPSLYPPVHPHTFPQLPHPSSLQAR